MVNKIELLKIMSDHFKFGLGEALEVYRYAEYRVYKNKSWIKQAIKNNKKHAK